MSCNYCYINFDLYDHRPLLASCSHQFCSRCSRILNKKLLKCPLDNLRVKFNQSTEITKISQMLKSKCENHELTMDTLCLTHLKICCPFCISAFHKDCETTKININQKIEEISSKISNLSKKIKKLKPSEHFFNLCKSRNKIKNLVQNIRKKFKDLKYFCPRKREEYTKISKIFPVRYYSVEAIQRSLTSLKGLLEHLSLPYFEDEAGLDKNLGIIYKKLNFNHLRLMKNLVPGAPSKNGYFFYIKPNIYQNNEKDLQIKGLGFGTPCHGSWLEILSLEVATTDTSNQTHSFSLNNEFLIDHQNTIKEIHFKKTLYSSPKENISILISLQTDGSCNLFQTSYYSQVNILNPENSEYNESIPILYLILS